MINSMDSAFDSQKFLSQQSISNSQKSTQDLFTPNSGSQERGNEKMSMYEKWLSKRSLYKHTTPGENKTGAWASCPSQASSLNQPKYNSSNIHHVPDNSHKGTEGRLSLYHTNKVKAYERDERILKIDKNGIDGHPFCETYGEVWVFSEIPDESTLDHEDETDNIKKIQDPDIDPVKDLLEQMAFILQENSNEMKGFANGMKDSMESLKGSLWEELQQTVSSFQNSMKKLQDDIQSSLQVKDQVFHEMEDLKTVVHKKDSEIMNLQARLQVVEKRKGDEIAQFAKTLSEELKSPQESITKKLEQISEKTGQVMENLNVCKENREIQIKDLQNHLKNIPTFIKDSEKRLMKELKKIEPEAITSLKIREAVEGCFENWLAEIQQLIKQSIDSFTKKKGIELKDAVTQEHRKNLDACLRKHLQTVSDKLEDVNQLFRSQHHIQESCLQAVCGWDLDKIKMSVEECKTTIENGAFLLKQIDQRSKHSSDHFFVPNHLEASQSLRRENDSVHSFNARKSNQQTFQVDRSSIETGQKAGFSHWNGDGQQMQHTPRVNEQVISNAYSHNHPESTTVDISYQVHQNSSFSSPNEFSKHCSIGKQHMSCCLTPHPARMPVINEFVEPKKIVMQSKPKVPTISPFCQPKSCKINPSPVATVKPLIKMNQTVYSNTWKENKPLSPHHNSQQNFKYDLRKRKMRDVPYYSKPEKETKLFLNKTSRKNPANSRAVQKGCQRNPNTMGSQNMKPVSKSLKYNDHDNQRFGVQSSKQSFQPQSGHDSFMNGIQKRKIPDNSSCNFKDERRAPSYLTWNNSRQKITTESYREAPDQSEEAKSGISSPCYSVYSIAMQTPLRHVSTALSARRAGQSYYHLMTGGETMRNSPHATLLSDM